MVQTDRRRRHDFRRFKQELEKLDSAEIRARLDSNRIRNPQRRAAAEEVLRRRAESGAGATGTAAAATGRAAAAPEGEAAPGRPDSARRGVPRGRAAGCRPDIALGRRTGRLLGAMLVVGGLTALLVTRLLRR